jgi:hypothetical protein
MPRTCILHLGTTKTGSTSIQHALHGMREALPAQGVYYPDTGNDVKHMMLAAAFASSQGTAAEFGAALWRGREPKTVIAEHIATFRAEMQALPPNIDRVILSAEQFSQYVRKSEDVARLHALLAAFFDRFIVVIYLRRQDAHFVSTHAELLRAGKPSRPDLGALHPFYHNYDYRQLIGTWAAVFGDAAMRPRVFERLPGSSFDVVSDFLAISGITAPPGAPAASRERNQSMTLTGQRILQNVAEALRSGKGRDLASRTAWSQISRAVSQTLPGQGWQPTRADAAALMAKFADSNEEVRARWFPERPSLFSMDFSNLPESAPVRDDAADFNACCDVLLALSTRAARLKHPQVKAKVVRARKAEDPQAYRDALVRAVKLDGADLLSRLQLARLQIEEGALRPARHHLMLASKQQPENPIAVKLLRRLERLERKAEAQAAGPPRQAKVPAAKTPVPVA